MTLSPIDAILQHLRNEPSRTWSIVITIFGDVVVPRGGSLWLGSLLEIFAGMGIKGGVVRTAMSRLAADEWFQRSRVGRNSFYSLTETGRASFIRASERIYGQPRTEWDGQFDLILSGSGSDREDMGRALASACFGSVAPGVWIAPGAAPVPPEADGSMQLQTRTDLATGRQLVERAWMLAPVVVGYRRFLDAFAPLWQSIVERGRLSDIEALVARTLLIHEYRRVVLRDPPLPLALLPEGWPGIAARQLASDIYRAVLPASERWLDENGQNEHGALPSPTIDLQGRFGASA